MKLQQLMCSHAIILVIGLVCFGASADAILAQNIGLDGYYYEYEDESKTGRLTVSRPLWEQIPQITRVNPAVGIRPEPTSPVVDILIATDISEAHLGNAGENLERIGKMLRSTLLPVLKLDSGRDEAGVGRAVRVAFAAAGPSNSCRPLQNWSSDASGIVTTINAMVNKDDAQALQNTPNPDEPEFLSNCIDLFNSDTAHKILLFIGDGVDGQGGESHDVSTLLPNAQHKAVTILPVLIKQDTTKNEDNLRTLATQSGYALPTLDDYPAVERLWRDYLGGIEHRGVWTMDLSQTSPGQEYVISFSLADGTIVTESVMAPPSDAPEVPGIDIAQNLSSYVLGSDKPLEIQFGFEPDDPTRFTFDCYLRRGDVLKVDGMVAPNRETCEFEADTLNTLLQAGRYDVVVNVTDAFGQRKTAETSIVLEPQPESRTTRALNWLRNNIGLFLLAVTLCLLVFVFLDYRRSSRGKGSVIGTIVRTVTRRATADRTDIPVWEEILADDVHAWLEPLPPKSAAGGLIELSNDVTVIGSRQDAADVFVPGSGIAGQHCRIRWTAEGTYTITANSYDHPTFVSKSEGESVLVRLAETEREYPLPDRARIAIGTEEQIYQFHIRPNSIRKPSAVTEPTTPQETSQSKDATDGRTRIKKTAISDGTRTGKQKEQAEAMAKLTWVQGQQGLPSEYLVDQEQVQIGRSDAPGSDFALDCEWVSGKHAIIHRKDDGVFVISDAGSSNHTFIAEIDGDERIVNVKELEGEDNHHELAHGDIIGFSDEVYYRFEYTAQLPSKEEEPVGTEQKTRTKTRQADNGT